MIQHMIFFVISGKPIFSIDIHPDGSRFATGGQGKKDYIKITHSLYCQFLTTWNCIHLYILYEY